GQACGRDEVGSEVHEPKHERLGGTVRRVAGHDSFELLAVIPIRAGECALPYLPQRLPGAPDVVTRRSDPVARSAEPRTRVVDREVLPPLFEVLEEACIAEPRQAILDGRVDLIV